MKTIADILREHSFFQDLSQEDLEFIAGCGKNVVFREGEVIASHGDPADLFYLIRVGQVSLILDNPPHTPFLFQTLGANEILGLSWLIPPYLWTAKAEATAETRAIAFDGSCIRKKCEKEFRLGYLLMKHLVSVLVKREDAIRLHLLDVYGK